MGYRVAVVGATGNVGREILNVLAERQFPLDEVAAVASARSTGDDHRFRRQRRRAQGQEPRAFRLHRLGHGAVRGGRDGQSKIYAPIAAAAGLHGDRQQLALPDGPGCAADRAGSERRRRSPAIARKNIIANPNCSTAQLVVALKPLHDAAKIKRVVVATYQSVSGAGKAGMDELFEQSRNIFVGDSNEPVVYHQADRLQRHSALRRLPRRRLDQGGMEAGRRDQEDPRSVDQGHRDLRSRAGVRRPFRGGEHRVRERDFAPTQAQAILREAPGVMLVDKREDGGYVTPVECVGDYATFVSRVREDPTVENGLIAVGGQRQSPQGRGAERGPDRRAARPQAFAEGGLGRCSPQ